MRFSSWIGRSFALLLLGSSSILATSEATSETTGGEPGVGTVEWEAEVLEQFREYLAANGIGGLNGSSGTLLERAVPAGITVFAEPPDGELLGGGPIVCDSNYGTATATFILDSGLTVITIYGLEPIGYHHYTTFSLVRASDPNLVNVIANPSFTTGLSPWTLGGLGLAFADGDGVRINSPIEFTTVSQALVVQPFQVYTLSFQHLCTTAPAVSYVTVNGITQKPGLLRLVPATDTGPSNTDGRTNVQAPILAGNAPPSSTIIIFVNGAATGVAMSLADGTFTYQLPVLSGSNAITAATFFVADQTSSPLATPITVIIDPVLSIALQSASDDGISGDRITTQTTLTFFGSGPINSPLTLSDNGAPLLSPVTDASGNWVFTLTTSIGSHTFRIADSTNVYANDPPKDLVVTVVAVPNLPALLGLSAESDTGITGDLKTADVTPTIIGTASPNALISLVDNGVPVGSGNADGFGEFSITLATLSPGLHTIVGTQTTTNGFLSGPSSGFVITILLEAPGLLDITPSTDTGTLEDLETANLDPTLVGTGLAGAQIILFKDGLQVGSGNSDNSGSFTVTASTLPGPGQYTFLAKQVSQGLDSELSNPLTVTIVPQPPVLVALTLDSDTGTPGDLETADTTPTIIGTASPGASLVLFLGNQQIGTGSADNSGGFMVTTSALGPPGVYGITARQTVLGFESELSQPFTITILPEAPILDGVDPSPGTNGNGILLASSRTPAIEGSAIPDANIIILEGNRIAGSGQSDSNGRFAITTNTELSLGVHTFTALAWTFEGLMSLRSLPFSIDVVDPEPSSSSITVPSSTTEFFSSTAEFSSSTTIPSSTSDAFSSTAEASSSTTIPSSTSEFFSSTAEASSSTVDITSASIEPSITPSAPIFDSSTFTSSDVFSTEPSSSNTREILSESSSYVSGTSEPSSTEPTVTSAETIQATASSGVTNTDSTSISSFSTASDTATTTDGSSGEDQETSRSTFAASTISVAITPSESISTIELTQRSSAVLTSPYGSAVSTEVASTSIPELPVSSSFSSVESLALSSIDIISESALTTVLSPATSTVESLAQATTAGPSDAPTSIAVTTDIAVESVPSSVGTTTPPPFTTTSEFLSFSMKFWNTSSTDVSISPTTTLDSLPTTADLASLTATGSPSFLTRSEASSTVQVPSVLGSTSTAVGSSLPSSTASVSFFLTIQFSAGVQRRQTQGQTYLSLVGDQLVATQSCVELPPVELVIDNGRLQTVSGSVITVAASVLTSPGYSSLQFDATPDPVDIQTTFAIDPISQDLTWGNPAFLNSEAQFCLLGNVLQASYTILVASIPGCIPVTLLPSNDVCSAAPVSSLSIIPDSATLNPTAFSPSISITQSVATGTSTSTGGTTITSAPTDIIIGIEITIEITIIYITIEINGNLVHTTTCESQTYTSPLVAAPSAYVDTSIIDGVTKYVTTTVPCGICQHKNVVPGEVTVYQVVTLDPSCTTSVHPVVESIKPCVKCQPFIPDTVSGNGKAPAGIPDSNIQPVPTTPAHEGQAVQTQVVYPQQSGKSAAKATDAVPVSTLVPDVGNTTKTESPVVYTGQALTLGPNLAFGALAGLIALNWLR